MSIPAQVQALDERILAAAHGEPGPVASFFQVITFLGGGWGLVVLVPFLIRRSTRALTAWLLAAVAVQSALVAILKAAVARPRPCGALSWCAALGAACPTNGSFPSGHAAGSFAFAAFVAIRAPRFAPAALLWAALVGWSRCVLGFHYPSDVLAGALIGSVVGALVARASMVRSAKAP